MTTIEDANFALQKVLDAGSQKNVIELAWIKNVSIQKQIETKISNNILNNHYLNKDEINIYLVNGEIIVD